MTVLENLRLAKANLTKLEKQFKNGKVNYESFTIDVCWGGQFKEYRTNFLLTNYPTINAY